MILGVLILVDRVSLAEYNLILRVYSHKLQMISMMVSARPVFIPLGSGLTVGRGSLIVIPDYLLVDVMRL